MQTGKCLTNEPQFLRNLLLLATVLFLLIIIPSGTKASEAARELRSCQEITNSLKSNILGSNSLQDTFLKINMMRIVLEPWDKIGSSRLLPSEIKDIDDLVSCAAKISAIDTQWVPSYENNNAVFIVSKVPSRGTRTGYAVVSRYPAKNRYLHLKGGKAAKLDGQILPLVRMASFGVAYDKPDATGSATCSGQLAYNTRGFAYFTISVDAASKQNIPNEIWARLIVPCMLGPLLKNASDSVLIDTFNLKGLEIESYDLNQQ